MLDYNDIEWNILGLAGGPDGSWGRGETDYLMGLCRSLDLRWPVIADRYSWADPEAAADTPPKQRGVDELKARYYSLAHTLLISRSEGAETVAHKELVRRPYDASAEADRREMLGALLQRSGGAAGEEEALLAAAAAVEARRRSEVEGAHKTGLPLQVLCRPAAPPPAQAPMGGGGSVVASLLGKLVIPDISLGPGDVDPNEEPGGPDLPTPRGQSQQPPPGCYARAAHTAACAQELVALGGAGTQGKPRDRKAADSLNRRIDLAMEELGVPAPQTGTRAVCRAWYALRKEVAQLLEVRPGGACSSPPSLHRHSPASPIVSTAALPAGAQEQGVRRRGGGGGGRGWARRRAALLATRRHVLPKGACIWWTAHAGAPADSLLSVYRRRCTHPPLGPQPLPRPPLCPAWRRHRQAACCPRRRWTAQRAPTSARRLASGRRRRRLRPNPRRSGEADMDVGHTGNAQHQSCVAGRGPSALVSQIHRPARLSPLARSVSVSASMRAMAGPLVGAAPCRLWCRQPSPVTCSVGAAARSTRLPVASLLLPARRVRVQRAAHSLTGTCGGAPVSRPGGCNALSLRCLPVSHSPSPPPLQSWPPATTASRRTAALGSCWA